MVSLDLARRLRDAGMTWKPAPGDWFAIPDRDMDDEVFVLSNMTIEVHELPEGPVIGFNGTTEWALDDLAKDEAIWLPREDQLREMLGGAFHRLEPAGEACRVTAAIAGRRTEFLGATAEEAYGTALLALFAATPR
jgi:hypothetical protein